jgi:hypothetical protein
MRKKPFRLPEGFLISKWLESHEDNDRLHQEGKYRCSYFLKRCSLLFVVNKVIEE